MIPFLLMTLRPAEHWMDDGYNYSVVCERHPGALMLNVSRRLATGQMSPIVGRRAFLEHEERLLGVIVGVEGPARTRLVDQIIIGGPIILTDLLDETPCGADLGQALH